MIGMESHKDELSPFAVETGQGFVRELRRLHSAFQSLMSGASGSVLYAENEFETCASLCKWIVRQFKVLVRSGWHSPDQQPRNPTEFQILLKSHPPYVRVFGGFSAPCIPAWARLEVSDGGSWIELMEPNTEETLSWFCGLFIFGVPSPEFWLSWSSDYDIPHGDHSNNVHSMMELQAESYALERVATEAQASGWSDEETEREFRREMDYESAWDDHTPWKALTEVARSTLKEAGSIRCTDEVHLMWSKPKQPQTFEERDLLRQEARSFFEELQRYQAEYRIFVHETDEEKAKNADLRRKGKIPF